MRPKKQNNIMMVSQKDFISYREKLKAGWVPKFLEKDKETLSTFSIKYTEDEIVINGNIVFKAIKEPQYISAIQLALMPAGTEYVNKDGVTWVKAFEPTDMWAIGAFVTTSYKDKQTFKIKLP